MVFGKKAVAETSDFEDNATERLEAILTRVTAVVQDLTQAQAEFAKTAQKAAIAARTLNKAVERAEHLASRNSR